MVHRFRRAGAALLVAALAVGLPTGGRSDSSGVDSLKLAQQHLSAVLTVQRWAELAYNLRPASEQPCEPSTSEPVANPDGSYTQTFVNPDCSRGTVTTQDEPELGGARFVSVVRYPDGFSERFEGTPGNPKLIEGIPFPQQYSIRRRLSTGDRARYVDKFQLQVEPTPFGPLVFITRSTATGKLFLADGSRISFRFVQQRPRDQIAFTDVLDLRLPRGERLHWEVPINLDEQVDLTRPAPGYYRAGNRLIRFAVHGEEGQLTRWTLSGARSLNGSFTLESDFSGRGRALRGKELEFVASWNRRARGTVLLADGRAAVAGPSAGAQDFGNARFRSLVLAHAPTPGL